MALAPFLPETPDETRRACKWSGRPRPGPARHAKYSRPTRKRSSTLAATFAGRPRAGLGPPASARRKARHNFSASLKFAVLAAASRRASSCNPLTHGLNPAVGDAEDGFGEGAGEPALATRAPSRG